MTNIVVSVLLKEDERALLVQTPRGDWELPTDELTEDESTEEAAERIARQMLTIDPQEGEFLDTYYERRNDAGGPIIRNVYCIPTWTGRPKIQAPAVYQEICWVGLDDIGKLATTETQRAILRDCLHGSPGSTDSTVAGAPITFIAGPRAAGKSTVAGLLCTRLRHAAHIEVDLLRDMVIAAQIGSDEADELSDTEERLVISNACALARNFSIAGYEAIIDDVIESPEVLNLLIGSLSDIAPIYLITLLPNEEVLASRDAMRDPELRAGERCLQMLSRFHRNAETRGLRLDSSYMSRSETVSWILANRDRARVF
jgi:ADP-ribose pyrophosphatase YjhB (NUDIX family)